MRSSIITILLIAFVLVSAIGVSLYRSSGLRATQALIVADFPNVRHLAANDFAARDKDEVIIFDVREADEYAVSHIEDAQQVDPDISVQDFMARFGEQLNGKTAVFYCSVGYRSSQLAARVDDLLRGQGAKSSLNLKGGLFNWHNEKRPLVSVANTSTQAIHPYNSRWGRMVKDQKSVSFVPVSGR